MSEQDPRIAHHGPYLRITKQFGSERVSVRSPENIISGTYLEVVFENGGSYLISLVEFLAGKNAGTYVKQKKG